MNYLFLLYPPFLFILMILNKLSHKKFEKTNIIFVSIVVSVIVGFRSLNAGNDTEIYIELFESINSFNDIFFGYMAWKGDYFFTLITFLIKRISHNPRFFLVAMGLFSTIILSNGLSRLYGNHKQKFNLICLFYLTHIPFLLFGNVIRQGIAISLLVFGFSFYNSRKSIFYIFLFLSFFTHKSAIIFLLFPIFNLIKGKSKYIIYLSFAFVLKSVMFIIITLIPFLNSKISFYQNNFLETENTLQVVLLTFLIILLLNKEIYSTRIKNDLIFNYCLFIIMMSFLFIDIPKISGRLFMWLVPVLPYILVNSFKGYKQEKVLKYSLIVISLIGSFAVMLSNQIQLNITYN